MAKTSVKVDRNTKIATTKTKRAVKLLKKPYVYLPLIIVCCILAYFSLQQYRASRERDAFQNTAQKTVTAIDAITRSIGTPLYDDRSNACFMRAPEKFSGKKLFCSIDASTYFRVTPENAEQLAAIAKSSLEENFSISMTAPPHAEDTNPIGYYFGAHILNSLGGISCAMDIRYPAITGGGGNLPSRNFNDNNVMSVGISCDKQVTEAIYPVVSR